MSLPKLTRKLHRWGALISAVPVVIILTTGFLLQLKKDWGWVQPPTIAGSSSELAIGWDRILEVARSVPEAEVERWSDVERVDVRPELGLLKLRCANRWELQLDTKTGDVLSSHYRRSDLIESIHDGSWFHDLAKSWIWLPTAVVLFGLWISGVYLWILPYRARTRRKGH